MVVTDASRTWATKNEIHSNQPRPVAFERIFTSGFSGKAVATIAGRQELPRVRHVVFFGERTHSCVHLWHLAERPISYKQFDRAELNTPEACAPFSHDHRDAHLQNQTRQANRISRSP